MTRATDMFGRELIACDAATNRTQAARWTGTLRRRRPRSNENRIASQPT